jgi:excisionase family DNA binding protein
MLIEPVTRCPLLKTEEAAKYLNLSRRTLEGLRRRGGGPQFRALSRNAVRYSLDDLQAWVDSRCAPHTAKARAILRSPMVQGS